MATEVLQDGRRVNLGVGSRDFKYYIFDWDDNILHMPTRIHLEKKGVLTKKFNHPFREKEDWKLSLKQFETGKKED